MFILSQLEDNVRIEPKVRSRLHSRGAARVLSATPPEPCC